MIYTVLSHIYTDDYVITVPNSNAVEPDFTKEIESYGEEVDNSMHVNDKQ